MEAAAAWQRCPAAVGGLRGALEGLRPAPRRRLRGAELLQRVFMRICRDCSSRHPTFNGNG